MPEPQADPYLAQTRTVALYALLAGLVITALKFGVFWLTDSVAVLSDALESIINVTAAGAMLYALWLSSQPADRDHPYGHGKAMFLAVGLEGWLILLSAALILYEAATRLYSGGGVDLARLGLGWWCLAGTEALMISLALYVYRSGKRYDNPVLIADGKHLFTDVASTTGVLIGLAIVEWTGYRWLDSVVALIVAGFILYISWRLLWESTRELMDTSDPEDDQTIRDILDDEVAQGHIDGYHKVRHRHNGPFHWVDMHLQVDGEMTVHDGHDLASRIEGRIERTLGQANATAHLEPATEGEKLLGPAPTKG